MEHLENDGRDEMNRRALMLSLPGFGADILILTYILSPFAALGLIPSSSPWWLYGPLSGLALAISGYLVLRWMFRVSSTNTTPTSIDIGEESLTFHLPPIPGVRNPTPREVKIQWPQVKSVTLGGQIRPSAITCQRGTATPNPAQGTTGDYFSVTRFNAARLDLAWKTWKQGHQTIDSSQPLK